MFEIEKNVPLPTKVSKGKFVSTIRKMEKGDSFYVPAANKDALSDLQSRLMQATRHSRAKGKFTTRRIKGNGSLGVRIWKTE